MVLTDFMLARETPDGDGTFLESTEVDGAAYKAPEQIDGIIDHRCDIYSVGMSLYHALSGCLPFDGDGLGMVLARCEIAPTPIREVAPDIPEPLAMVVMKMIEPNPEHRFKDAIEAIAALTLALTN